MIGLWYSIDKLYSNSQFGLTDASTERKGERLNRVGLDGVSYLRVQPARPTRFFTQRAEQ